MITLNQRIGFVVILLACGMALPVAGQSLDSLQSSFHLENSMLERESERYARARDLDRQALQRLLELVEQMDQALFDEQVPVSDLRSLEGDLNVARETAMERLRASSEVRTNIYDHLDRLDHLGQEIELLGDRTLVQTERLDGVWEIDASTAFSGAYGLMKLTMNGTVIHGTYRMSTGAQGTLFGSLVNDEVKLSRIDSQYGNDIWINGTYDRDKGEISGTWNSKIIGDGRPGYGEWSAVKISPDEAREVAEKLTD
jgi:hypothetical protein